MTHTDTPVASFDYERARQNMIEQQIRPWDVLDPAILALLSEVPREAFVPPHLRTLAFTDTELPLTIEGQATGEVMLAPKVEARLLQALELKAHEQVLEIGTGSGYMAALAAHRVDQVISVEIQPILARFAQSNLERCSIQNVRVEMGDGAQGWSRAQPADTYDAIIVSGAVPAVPPSLLAQLKIGGRMVAIVGTVPVMTAQLITRAAPDTYLTESLFETLTKPLINAWQPSTFQF